MATAYPDLLQTSSLPDAIRVIYSNELEFTTRPVLIVDQPAFVEPWEEFGQRRGNQVTRTIYHQLAPAIRPLTENVDVDAGGLTDHQISLSIAEYGAAQGTTEKLDLVSYHGPISSIIKTLLAPQMALTMDTLARNAMWYAPNLPGGVKYVTYAMGARTDRYHLQQTDVLTSDMVKQVAHRLNVRMVPVIGGREPSFIALAHPSVIYDLRSDSLWKDANLYAGSTRLFNGEEGMIHGVRFLKSVRLRIPNGGALVAQSTLAAGTYAAGTSAINVASATGFAVNQEVTLHNTGANVTAPPASGGGAVSWVAPQGTDPIEETVVIKTIATNTITFQTPLLYTHNAGDYITEALDVYPVSVVGGIPPLAKGVVVPPEVRVSIPTDKLRRTYYVGWYSLLGYGVQRDWAYEQLELCGSQNIASVYGSQQG